MDQEQSSKSSTFEIEDNPEVENIWMFSERKAQSNETIYDSDLFDLEIDLKEQESEESIKQIHQISKKKMKLEIVKLDSISISSTEAQMHIVNLKQSFTFPAVLKPSQQISTQTSQIDLMKHCQPTVNDEVFRHFVKRPTSLPPENAALSNIKKRVQADIEPTLVGDGDKRSNIEKDLNLTTEMRSPDLELSGFIAPSPAFCAMNQPKSTRQSTPKFNCKKVRRPLTKHTKKIFIESKELGGVQSKKGVKCSSKKPKNLFEDKETTSSSHDASSYCVFKSSGSNHVPLTTIVDKLQDQDWEICTTGMQILVTLANNFDWESENVLRYIPIISRKLIDFFKSPRSTLCRTACQTAGEFFLLTKCTTRPEFDEMVDILLCKTADPNRFIQKDANIALDKMAVSICIHHSIRAICSRGPNHKSSIVRASTARLLKEVCKHAGIEVIVGSDANPRTRQRVLNNLAKFLIDKNQEARRHAESLCKMLKHHKLFIEYFFKDIDNNFKTTLRKIINSLD